MILYNQAYGWKKAYFEAQYSNIYYYYYLKSVSELVFSFKAYAHIYSFAYFAHPIAIQCIKHARPLYFPCALLHTVQQFKHNMLLQHILRRPQMNTFEEDGTNSC